MLKLDRNALICDMAETYNIYDLKALPVTTVALLACGLRENSRIMQKINGIEMPVNTILLAHIADRLGILIWQNTKDGQRGRNRPESIAAQMIAGAKPKSNHMRGAVFDSPEDFEKARKRILERQGKTWPN